MSVAPLRTRLSFAELVRCETHRLLEVSFHDESIGAGRHSHKVSRASCRRAYSVCVVGACDTVEVSFVSAWLGLAITQTLAACHGHGRSEETAAPESIVFSPRSPVVLPMTLTAAFQAYVPASINGSLRYPFKLDTGSVTLLDPKRVPGAVLSRERTDHFSGANGISDAVHVSNVEVAFDGLRLTLPDVVAVSMDESYPDVDLTTAGIIGAEVFESVTVELDFPASQVRVYDQASYRHQETGVAVPFTVVNGSPAVQASLALANGELASGLFLLDTGCECDVVVMSPFAERHHLHQKKLTELGRSANPNFEVGHAIGLRVGLLHADNPVVGLPSGKVPFLSRRDIDGLIGASMLHRFRLTFDYQKKIAWFDASTTR